MCQCTSHFGHYYDLENLARCVEQVQRSPSVAPFVLQDEEGATATHHDTDVCIGLSAHERGASPGWLPKCAEFPKAPQAARVYQSRETIFQMSPEHLDGNDSDKELWDDTDGQDSSYWDEVVAAVDSVSLCNSPIAARSVGSPLADHSPDGLSSQRTNYFTPTLVDDTDSKSSSSIPSTRPPSFILTSRINSISTNATSTSLYTSNRPDLTLDLNGSAFESPQSSSPPRPNLRHNESYREPLPIIFSTFSSAASPPVVFPDLDLNTVIIAHDKHIQSLFDSRNISQGVQWEIARGVSHNLWAWDEITPSKLDQLRGPAIDAVRKVKGVIHYSGAAYAISPVELSVWREVEREQAALLENQGRGLGLKGDYRGVENWYGGRIQQMAQLYKTSSGYVIRLERIQQQNRSNEFARYLGSLRLLHVRIPKDLVTKESTALRDYLNAKFIICGRVFVPFHAKDNTVYMLETDENFERRPDPSSADHLRISLQAFVQLYNPMHLNANQPISKWATRFALGLSNSTPALEFEAQNIMFVEDIVADRRRPKKSPAEAIMTDGCGFMNGSALSTIRSTFGLSCRPAAVQGRIAGSKGLWILHPTDRSPTEPPRIWIRQSQKKINLPNLDDRLYRIFNYLAPARVTFPYRMSMQSILNLSYNGVPDEVLTGLMRRGLSEELTPLMDWDRPQAMQCLWKKLHSSGVGSSRLQRQARGLSRALGLAGRDMQENIPTDVEPELEDSRDSWTSRDHYSGSPLSLYENALEMVQAGFHPKKCPVLCEKIRHVVTNVIQSYVTEFKISVPQSLEVFIVPDPFGVLEEGEVYFRSSDPLIDAETGVSFDTLKGPLLVGRNPMRLPADIQLFMGVDRSELREFYDILVVSVKGFQSPASFLSGGDYDGDWVFVIWDQLLTGHFRNAAYTPPPDNFKQANFSREVTLVRECISKFNEDYMQHRFRGALLAGVADTKVGLYSLWHDTAVYERGLGNEETMFLAHMSNAALDSNKTALYVTDHKFKQHQATYNRERPACMSIIRKPFPGPPTHRNKDLGPFILETLISEGKKEKERHLIAYDELKDQIDHRNDPDLLKPYNDARCRVQRARTDGYELPFNELQRVENHVDTLQEEYNKLWACSGLLPQKSLKKERGSHPQTDALLALSRKFAEGPVGFLDLVNPEEVKASYAYSRANLFGFALAFTHLCQIKSRAQGSAGMALQFGECMSIPGAYLRVWEATFDLKDELV